MRAASAERVEAKGADPPSLSQQQKSLKIGSSPKTVPVYTVKGPSSTNPSTPPKEGNQGAPPPSLAHCSSLEQPHSSRLIRLNSSHFESLGP